MPMYLNVQETAELLRRSTKAIYTMIERGQIPGVRRVRGRILFRSSELLDWIEQSRAVSSEE